MIWPWLVVIAAWCLVIAVGMTMLDDHVWAQWTFIVCITILALVVIVSVFLLTIAFLQHFQAWGFEAQ